MAKKLTNRETRVMQLMRRAVRLQAELEEVKGLYIKLDETLAELVKLGAKEVELNGQPYALVDLMAERTTIFKASAFRRWTVMKVGGAK